MRFLPTRIHGLLDYLVGVLLVFAPWLFGFAYNGAETWIPVLLGIAAIVYSLLTNYELGALPILSMPTHLALDAASGIVLALSPWVFGFASVVWVPHLIIGLFEIGASLMTRTRPEIVRPPFGLARSRVPERRQ